MPYIAQVNRDHIAAGHPPDTAGELNYCITRMVDAYISRVGGIRYAALNEAIGVLECAKLELYRRLAAPYEDGKCATAGEVYRARAG